MERQEIEIFLALAEELHFARTAERLHLAPASISQTVKKLERRFGAPLFTRTTRRAELTALGRQLRDELGPAYEQVRAAIARAGQGLRVGYMSAAIAERLVPLVAEFPARVSIRETGLADLCGPLRRGEVDLSVLPLPIEEPDLTVGPVLLSEPARLAVPADHAADREHFLFVQGLPAYWIDHHLPAPSTTARITTLPGFQEVLAYVAAGLGVAVVGAQTERLYPRPGLKCEQIKGVFRYAFVWRADDPGSRLREEFVRAAQPRA
ncbi:LysR family transcriptional regulator [Paractinoplanes rishiriensis]|uniref:LysR family transcriptional regulator n=1 Tax=Paractinoplanes rishiriensis TaxID=1050105 RepID=A0A919JXL8_9ACTN|nr:LysR family transcriptional regulator [Actinoplanes rishiriensis]GIE95372.1 LysR family transcriptional regulator [Actinoplanes rishiriensis]